MVGLPGLHRGWTASGSTVPVLVSLALATGGFGAASAATVSTPIVTGLSQAVTDFEVTGKTLLVVQGDHTVSRITRDGTVTDLTSVPNGAYWISIQGVAQGRFGRTYFTETVFFDGYVRVRSAGGRITTLADTGAYEREKNPDAKNTYGVLGMSGDCAAQVPEHLRPHRGNTMYGSHPGALARTRYGLFLADSAANAILFVNWQGKIRTVAVLPPQRIRITPEITTRFGLPACTLGKTIAVEQAPTDVELSRYGLIVSTMTGLERGGSVYLAGWHKTKRLATGLGGGGLFGGYVYGVAVSPRGAIYVSEFGANRVSRITVRRPGNHRGHHARSHGWRGAFRLAPPQGDGHAGGRPELAMGPGVGPRSAVRVGVDQQHPSRTICDRDCHQGAGQVMVTLNDDGQRCSAALTHAVGWLMRGHPR